MGETSTVQCNCAVREMFQRHITTHEHIHGHTAANVTAPESGEKNTAKEKRPESFDAGSIFSPVCFCDTLRVQSVCALCARYCVCLCVCVHRGVGLNYLVPNKEQTKHATCI